ncbi:ATP-binding protein, partial [Bifidobacterium catenulatum]|uniref:ATP-binding protein n=1 Tax=Bifidobacterium catenulatum TaxID=1686 RepID=UPI0034DFF1AA
GGGGGGGGGGARRRGPPARPPGAPHDGPGFSPAALERGCERLFTDDSSRSSRDGGRHYGLGLHAASEAASAHGGSVSLANSPSGGAVTTIAVPL